MDGNCRAEWIAELDFEVCTPPRQILESVPGVQAQEMHRPSDLRVAIPVYGLA
jgi:hypothetical protein